MRKTILALLSIAAALLMTGCSAVASEHRTGQAEGYGGMLSVSVETRDGKITDVKVEQHQETEGVGTRAIDALPARMIAENTWEVEAVSGATVTSNALKAAVASAMGVLPSPEMSTDAPDQADQLRSGMGMVATGRVGPGTDAQGNPVYSFNVVFAHVTFDQEGRMTDVAVDQLEVATPNYDGTGMPHFSGFPGQGGWALHDDAAGDISGKTGDTEEDFLAEVAAWRSKRARGEDYQLNHGSWRSQMDAYQTMLQGKTVDEAEAWFGKYFSPDTGRPLVQNSGSEEDQQQYSGLTDEEKSELADVTSGATMSLRDVHGDILTALRRAWEDAQEN